MYNFPNNSWTSYRNTYKQEAYKSFPYAILISSYFILTRVDRSTKRGVHVYE